MLGDHYVGETGRSLKIRLKEHRTLKEKDSALVKHVNETHHDIDFEKTDLVSYEENWVKRKITEALYMKKCDHFQGNTSWDLLVF